MVSQEKTKSFFNPYGFKIRMRDLYTNPSETKRIESFEIFGLTKRIHKTNLWKTGLRNESTIRIFGSSCHETNPRFKSLRIGLTNPDSRICEVRIRDTIRNESFWSQDSWLRYETNPRFYESLIRFPHP
jgi:hypothetical protein